MGSSRASSGSTSAVCVCISLSPLAKGSSAARRGLQGGLQARWSQRGLCDAPHLELSERRGFGLQACVGAEGFITLCSRMPTSCLALSCLSHCPSEATSLAAPQDPRPPQALQPLCGCVGKGTLAGHCFPPGAEVLLEQPGALWDCPPTLPAASLCLPRTTRSSGSGHLSTWLGAAAPWLPSTSWASSTWPTLVTAGTALQGSPHLLLSGWGHPSRVGWCWRHGW